MCVANHLQSSNNKPEPSFGFAADQKRIQYKERGRSMNSTGSGKSSTVSSVSELLDLYEEDPEEILLNLGFGREEPDLSSKVPSRFFGSSSSARGIDIKVFLGAQMQRMELENPNYALTSRFRQIEVLTTVANEFFQLYSQVSGQPVWRISKEQVGEGEEEGGGGGGNEDESPKLKRTSSARTVANFLKKTLTRHNLLSAASESPGEVSPNQDAQRNGNATTPDHSHINGQKHSGPEQEGGGSGSDHQGETANQKQSRKKDSFRLEMVVEETSGGGETDQPLDSNPEQSRSGPEHQPGSADLQETNQRKEVEGNQVAKEETNLTSPPETAASSLAPLGLAKLCTENTDSFDIEEIHTNEDEAPSHRTSRTTDFSRTVSQQSDSSGFAEEPSVDSNSSLKVQESSDSCDSETTVTSHPSQDVATPHALDQPAFDLPDGRKEEAGLDDAANTDGRSRSSEEDAHEGSSDQAPQYAVHLLLKDKPAGEEEQVDGRDMTSPDSEPRSSQNTSEQEPQPELGRTQNQPFSEQEPEYSEMTADTKTPTERPEDVPLHESGSLCPASPVLDALNRAKRNQLCLMGQHNSIQSTDTCKTPGRGGGRGRRVIPMQRSSSLPSSLLLPSKVVSSVKIQFRQGQASCTPPRYSFKYTQEAGEEVKEEEEEEEEEKQINCVSTVVINPRSKENPPAGVSPKPISPYLPRSSCSLHSASPPTHLSAGGHTQPWSTQSVPDLTFGRHQPGPFNQNQQIWSPGPGMYPTQSPSTVFSDPSPYPSPSSNSGLFPFSAYPYIRPPYLTNQHNLSLNHYSSLTSLHQPLSPLITAHSNNLHQPPVSTAPYHLGLGHLHSGTPPVPHQGYSHPYTHHLPYPVTPHSSQYGSPYQGTPGFSMSPLLHPGLGPSAASGLEPGRCQSSTEMQLRKVLHEIRGTVQSLNQSRVNTPDTFSDLRGASQQSLAEFQQKRRSLNIFRSQMMDLELAVMRQEALVYKHLSPADRLEAEQLQSLRSAVRQELQELEQQVEDHLLDLTSHLHDTALHADSSFDNLSTASALRAMEPVSDLLRQQFFLQSELIYDGHDPTSDPSARSPSPVRGDEDDGNQRQGVYRASVNITPAPPPRPNTHTEEEDEEDEGEREGADTGKERVEEDSAEKEGAGGKLGVDSLQQLIREIRESVAQQVRREIYQELLAAASSQDSPLSSRQKPL